MAVRHITVPVSGDAHAVLTVPQPMTADSLGRLERDIVRTLSELRRGLEEGAAECGRLEYQSWIEHLREARA